MGDYIVSALGFNGTVRAYAAVTTEIVKEAREIHALAPTATAALGRVLTAGVLMSKLLKGERDVLTLQVKGDGPLGGIVAVTDSASGVRGYVNFPEVELPLNEAGKFDVSGAVGKNGYLNVIKDIGMREPYQGYVRLVSGEIAEDVAYYFAFSEQIPSAVSLGVLLDRDGTVLNSGGFLLQLMPEADEGAISGLEEKINGLPGISQLLASGNSPQDILELLFGENNLRLLGKTGTSYACNCSRDRMERNIISLGAGEIRDMLEEQRGAEAQCHFCNKKYRFTEEDLKRLLEEAKTPDMT